MVAILSIAVFVGALAASVGVIALTVGPQWRRVMHLALGGTEQNFTPLAQLAQAERRIAVRRWAAQPMSAPIRRLRAAA